MDDKLTKIREEYIVGNREMEFADMVGQDLFYRFMEQGIYKLGIKIDEEQLTNLPAQAVVDYLQEMLKAYSNLKYYQENVDKEEVQKLYD